jgi:hypothetical protein
MPEKDLTLKEALELSRKKWETIVAGGGKGLGKEELMELGMLYFCNCCPLCEFQEMKCWDAIEKDPEKFNRPFDYIEENLCNDCLLNIPNVGPCMYGEHPYSQWVNCDTGTDTEAAKMVLKLIIQKQDLSNEEK